MIKRTRFDKRELIITAILTILAVGSIGFLISYILYADIKSERFEEGLSMGYREGYERGVAELEKTKKHLVECSIEKTIVEVERDICKEKNTEKSNNNGVIDTYNELFRYNKCFIEHADRCYRFLAERRIKAPALHLFPQCVDSFEV